MAENTAYPQTPIESRARVLHTPEPEQQVVGQIPSAQDSTLPPPAGSRFKIRSRNHIAKIRGVNLPGSCLPLRFASREHDVQDPPALGTPFATPAHGYNAQVAAVTSPAQLMSSPPSGDDGIIETTTTNVVYGAPVDNVFIHTSSPDLPYQLPITPVNQMIGDEEDLIRAKNAWEFTPPVLSSDTYECRTFDNSRPSTARSGNSAVGAELLDTAATSPELPPLLDFAGSTRSALEVYATWQSRNGDGNGFSKEDMLTPELQKRHLHATLLKYMNDPLVTPFKMLPGSSLPTGAANRVLREARRTWSVMRDNHARRKGLDGITDLVYSEHWGLERRLPAWPNGDHDLRLTLQNMCKTNTGLAPVYARSVAQTPSSDQTIPSTPPALSSSPPASRRRGSRVQTPVHVHSAPPAVAATSPYSSFNTRDIGISLVTSTADTMQPDGFLNQLGRDNASYGRKDSVQMGASVGRKSGASSTSSTLSMKRRFSFLNEPPPVPETAITKEITRRLSMTQPHQRAQSLHHNLIARSSVVDGPSSVLGSPFEPMPNHARAGSLRVRPVDAPRAALKSPINIVPQHATKRLRKSVAPRPLDLATIVKHDEPVVDENTVRRQSYDAVHISTTRPQVRNRGFTMSAIQHGIHNPQGPITSIFTEDAQRMPVILPRMPDNTQRYYAQPSVQAKLAATRNAPVHRPAPSLGSPFLAPTASGIPISHTFPRMAGNVQDTLMRDEHLIAPQPRRLHGIIAPPPDNATLRAWRSLSRGESPL